MIHLFILYFLSLVSPSKNIFCCWGLREFMLLVQFPVQLSCLCDGWVLMVALKESWPVLASYWIRRTLVMFLFNNNTKLLIIDSPNGSLNVLIFYPNMVHCVTLLRYSIPCKTIKMPYNAICICSNGEGILGNFHFQDHFKLKCHFHFLIHWVLLKSL